MKKWKSLLLAIICNLCLTGCVTEYDRDDVAAYAEEQLKLKHCKVSSNYQEVENQEGYTDHVCTVTDKDNQVEFHIIDYFTWAGETLCNYLRDDYSEAVVYQKKDELDFESLQADFYMENGRYEGQIIGSFKSEEELTKCCEELLDVKNQLEKLGFENLAVSYDIIYEHPYRTIGEYEDTSGDTIGVLSNEINYQKFLFHYILTSYDYRYEVIDTFASEDIEKALSELDRFVGIYEGDKEEREDYETEKIRYYDDLVADQYGYGISFSTLYEILKREGFEPEGEPWHYLFVGAEDVFYEISYDFNDYPFESYGEEKYGYYYKKDGEKMPMGYYFYTHFRPYQIEEMTGLKVVY